jgi:hypothetical protein
MINLIILKKIRYLPTKARFFHMKKTTFTFLALLLITGACKKSDTTTSPAPVLLKYMSLTAGSTWNYNQADNLASTSVNYTLSSTTRDTTINGNSYHIFINSNGGNSEYYFISGNNYYTFRTLGVALGGTAFENLYLKDNLSAGGNWAQTLSLTIPGVPVPVPVTVTYTIQETGISRTVNSIAYSDVIHVKTAISSSLVPSANLVTNIDSYYARKYGLIENTTIFSLNFMGIVQNTNTKTILLSANIN